MSALNSFVMFNKAEIINTIQVGVGLFLCMWEMGRGYQHTLLKATVFMQFHFVTCMNLRWRGSAGFTGCLLGVWFQQVSYIDTTFHCVYVCWYRRTADSYRSSLHSSRTRPFPRRSTENWYMLHSPLPLYTVCTCIVCFHCLSLLYSHIPLSFVSAVLLLLLSHLLPSFYCHFTFP